jgi:hypothetical protein
MPKTKTFGDYKAEGHKWIALATGEYYPDILKDACELYKPVLVAFSQLLKSAESSTALCMRIAEESDGWMRVQLARVFRKYVSPETPVKRLGPNMRVRCICDEYGKRFRPIREVQAAFASRPLPDEVMCAILWEYREDGTMREKQDRGPRRRLTTARNAAMGKEVRHARG